MRLFEVIKTKKPLMEVINDQMIDGIDWHKIAVKSTGFKGTRLVIVNKTGMGEKPDEDMKGFDIHEYVYVVSSKSVCLVSFDIP